MSAVVLLDLPFDVSDGGLVESGSTGQWEWGTPTTGPGPGPAVWATRLGANYANDTTDTLELDLPDLTTATRPTLVLEHWYDIAGNDGGTLWIHDGVQWSLVAPLGGYPASTGFTGRSGAFVTDAWTLPQNADRARLVFHADATGSAPGWYLGRLGVWDGDVTPPSLEPLDLPDDTTDPLGPYTIVLRVTDDVAVTSVEVEYAWDGVIMGTIAASASGDSYTVALPGAPLGTRVTWSATATDGSQAARFPATGHASFRVFLPAPTDFHCPDARVVGDHVHLVWNPPVTDVPILGYRVDEIGGDEGTVDVTDTFADLPVSTPGPHTWVVAARHAGGFGDAAPRFTAEVEVPALLGVTPADAWPGDHVRVDVITASTYLLSGATEATLRGDGADDLVPSEVVVLDADHAVLDVRVPLDAPEGPRDLVITGAYGESTFPAAFHVNDDLGRPSISTSPGGVEQGFFGVITFSASVPFAGPVTADAGPDADLVIGDVTTDGAVATAEITVAGDASPGGHTVVLDDGERLWTAPIVVIERPIVVQRGCATAPGGAVAGAFAALIATRGSRRSSRRARSR